MSIIEINAKNERTLKMYSNLIEEIIRSHTDKNKFNTGFSFFKRNLVINDYSKVDGDNITFYATVIDENHRNNYTAIISINTKTRVISNMSCDCHSLLSNTKPQICSHIVATVLNGLENLNKETNDEYSDEITEWIGDDRLIVLTAHRRENLGEPMYRMFKAIRRIIDKYDDVKMVYPVHLNPLVVKAANEVFGDSEKIKLIKPLEVVEFHNLLSRSYLILTDSGGIQEEAPSLGKPVIVLRDTTERPEGIDAGTLKLAGTEEETIYQMVDELLSDSMEYEKMSKASNPYGDGHASERIVDAIIAKFSKSIGEE